MTHLLCFTYSLIIWPTMGDKRTWDCVKIPFQVIIDLLNGFIPLSPPPPLLHSPHSHPLSFPPMVLTIQLCLGWAGRVISFTNITGNWFQHFWPLLCILLYPVVAILTFIAASVLFRSHSSKNSQKKFSEGE